MEPYQVLPLQVRVDPETMAMKDLFHIAQNTRTVASESDHSESYPGHLSWEWVFSLCRDAIGVFTAPANWANDFWVNSL